MKQFDRLRIGLAVFVTLAIWQHFHDGVPAHHLLQNPDLPRISNWFGGLLLPVLTWGCWGLGAAWRRQIPVPNPGPSA